MTEMRAQCFERFHISLLSDFPCCNHENFHEEGVMKIVLCLLDHGEEAACIVPNNVEGQPSSCGKRICEEKVTGGHFNILSAENTSIIIPYNMEFFSSKKIHGIKPVFEE